LQDNHIVIFSSDDWGWKTSKYQLSTRFSKNNKVLFVSSIGFRSPKASAQDIYRILNKLKSFFRGIRKVDSNLHVLAPLVIPFNFVPYREKINAVLIRLQLKYAFIKLEIKTPYVFVFSQNWCDYVEHIKRRRLIYYCIDEHSGFDGIEKEKFNKLDKKMASISEFIFCSSYKLYEKYIKRNSSTFYMPHGVNYELFSSAINDKSLVLPDDLKNIPKPIFLFFGHISYDWIEVELLKYIAKNRPEWFIVLLGRYSVAEDEFAGYPNIVYLGEKDITELPAYCKGSDVGLIPFVKSELTDNCNPLKLPEYASAGLPVVSTDIPEVRKQSGLSRIGKSYDEFLQECEIASLHSERQSAMDRSNSMSEHTWDHRVESIYKILANG